MKHLIFGLLMMCVAAGVARVDAGEGEAALLLADIQYDLDTCPQIGFSSTLEWSCFETHTRRLREAAAFHGSEPEAAQVEAARLLGHYLQHQYRFELKPLPDPLRPIATLQTDEEVIWLAEAAGVLIKTGMPFSDGVVVGVRGKQLWFFDHQKGLRTIELEGLSDDALPTVGQGDFVLRADGAELPVLRLAGQALGLTLSGRFAGNTVTGIWRGNSAADLFYNLLEDRGHRFMQQGKILVIPSGGEQEQTVFAKISHLRRREFLRKVCLINDLPDWAVRIDEDVLISEAMMREIQDDFDIDVLLRKLADQEGLCYVHYLGNYRVGDCSEVKRWKNNKHLRAQKDVRLFLLRLEQQEGFTKKQIQIIEEGLKFDYDLAHRLSGCVGSGRQYPREYTPNLIRELDRVITQTVQTREASVWQKLRDLILKESKYKP
ncbi:hypothetical protein [Acanthopleuribacter pedis]|uniref:Uncharacterized protein n=1 Tax=Acanthopleuribacter pedis TaxID=442870 RepID=A0A8J7Q5H2_9BACT|nr:hypothetical protein [Acanthopleuribacter pedis]MBO1320782.1 hypothetical protein [Acanthopleuribacter pedis]